MNEIDVQTLSLQLSRGDDVFVVDVRTPAEFTSGHIPQAINRPLGDVSPQSLSAEAQGRPMYIVCQSGGRSARCCEALINTGAPAAVNVLGGTQAWKDAGFPVKTKDNAKKVISIERQVRIGAGTFVLLGVVLGYFIHPVFYLLSAFVGCGLIYAGVTGWCGMGLLLAKMSWNKK